MLSSPDFLSSIGKEVVDAEEEAFLLFTRDIPSANLGVVDFRAATVEITIHEQDFVIHQSPALLTSTRSGGTTGAVLWKITPRFAEWISSRATNPLWTSSLLTSDSTVVELGCGISGLVALSLGPLVGQFIATDQEYVRRLFRENVEENAAAVQIPHENQNPSRALRKKKKSAGKAQRGKASGQASGSSNSLPNISFTPLDWELDVPSALKDTIPHPQRAHRPAAIDDDDDDDDEREGKDRGFDLLLSCDCIYNDALIPPFVRTCADICRLRPAYDEQVSLDGMPRRPTVVVIAQQQRSPEVFEAWLQETLHDFRVWRLSDEVLGEGLRAGTGYVVHVLLVRG